MNSTAAPLVDQLYQGTLTTAPSGFRAWMLARLAQWLSLSGAIWRRRRIGQAPHSVTPWGLAPAAPAILFRTQAQNPIFDYAFADPGTAFALDRLAPLSPGDGQALAKRVLGPLSIAQFAMVVHRDERAGLDTEIIVLRGDDAPAFSDDELQLLQSLAPFLVGAARMSMFVDAAQPSAEQWNRASAVVDLESQILEAQPAFLDLLAEHYPRWQGPRLPFALPVTSDRGVHAIGALAVLAEPMADLTRLRIWPREAMTGLTERERAVAAAVADGHSYKEIARRLGITASTVSNHLQRIYAKLEINSRADLMRLWREIAPQAPSGAAPSRRT